MLTQETDRLVRSADFRNQLTHEYPAVDDAIVWAIIDRDVPVLLRECRELIQRQTQSGPGGDTETE